MHQLVEAVASTLSSGTQVPPGFRIYRIAVISADVRLPFTRFRLVADSHSSSHVEALPSPLHLCHPGLPSDRFLLLFGLEWCWRSALCTLGRVVLAVDKDFLGLARAPLLRMIMLCTCLQAVRAVPPPKPLRPLCPCTRGFLHLRSVLLARESRPASAPGAPLHLSYEIIPRPMACRCGLVFCH